MARYKLVNNVKIQFTAAEETARDIEEQAWNNGALDRALYILRNERNGLLLETDYLALSDNTLTAAMATYRTALRDLPNGKDTVAKCENAVFPTKP